MRLLGYSSIVALTAVLCTAALGAVPGEIVFYGDEAVRPPTNAANYAPTEVAIQFDAEIFFRIRTGAVGYSVAERESIVLQRIVEAVGAGKIAPVYVDEVRGAPTVYIDRYRIVTVYPQDVVAAAAPSAEALAYQWAAGLRRGLERTAPTWIVEPEPVFNVGVGPVVILRLRTAAGYDSLRDRAAAVNQVLPDLMVDFDPALVAIRPVEAGTAVLYDGRVVVVATPGDAAAEGAASAEALGAEWAQRLRALLPLCAAG
jgi:hypothetical protein